jgi:hypothetical protein
MASLVPTGKAAGEYTIPELGKTIKLVEWREDDFYDTVQQATGLSTAGTTLEYFRDLTSKNLQHTNLKTPRRIPSGSEFILQRIGVVIAQAVGATVQIAADILLAAYAATLTFKINERLISEGPLFKYQSGYGMAGGTTANNTSLITTGVPSAAAAPQLLVQQTINDQADLQGTIEFKACGWLATTTMPTFTNAPAFGLMLHGLVKKPQGN